MTFEFTKRRLFLSTGEDFFQLFSFTQDRGDASIYVSSPDFSKIKWLNLTSENDNPQLIVTDSPGDGKLSVHGSGVTKITPNIDKLVVHGNYLLDSKKKVAGVRHLFTVQLAEPKFIPASPVFNRAGDCVITTKQLAPIVIIFFAIPRVKSLTVKYQVSFNMDDLESIPPESGGGTFELLLHNVFWFAYRTKYMNGWPRNPHICYCDGHIVPVLIGIGDKKCRAEFRVPIYKMSGTEVSIIL